MMARLTLFVIFSSFNLAFANPANQSKTTEWTNTESAFYTFLVRRNNQPKIDRIVQNYVLYGYAWIPDDPKRPLSNTRLSYDWSEISKRVPEGLSERGEQLFWSLLYKAFLRHEAKQQERLDEVEKKTKALEQNKYLLSWETRLAVEKEISTDRDNRLNLIMAGSRNSKTFFERPHKATPKPTIPPKTEFKRPTVRKVPVLND